jgi:hypothetical protein
MSDRLVAVRGRTLAAQHNLPYVDLAHIAFDPNAVHAVPLEVLERLNAVPFDLIEEMLHVALTEPSPAGVARRDSTRSHRKRHGLALERRPREGRGGSDLGRRAPPCGSPLGSAPK